MSYTVPAGFSSIVVDTAVTVGDGYLGVGLSGDPIVDGDLWVFETVTQESGLEVIVAPDGLVSLGNVPTIHQTFDFYVVQSVGDVVGSTATFLISVYEKYKNKVGSMDYTIKFSDYGQTFGIWNGFYLEQAGAISVPADGNFDGEYPFKEVIQDTLNGNKLHIALNTGVNSKNFPNLFSSFTWEAAGIVDPEPLSFELSSYNSGPLALIPLDASPDSTYDIILQITNELIFTPSVTGDWERGASPSSGSLVPHTMLNDALLNKVRLLTASSTLTITIESASLLPDAFFYGVGFVDDATGDSEFWLTDSDLLSTLFTTDETLFSFTAKEFAEVSHSPLRLTWFNSAEDHDAWTASLTAGGANTGGKYTSYQLNCRGGAF